MNPSHNTFDQQTGTFATTHKRSAEFFNLNFLKKKEQA